MAAIDTIHDLIDSIDFETEEGEWIRWPCGSREGNLRIATFLSSGDTFTSENGTYTIVRKVSE